MKKRGKSHVTFIMEFWYLSEKPVSSSAAAGRGFNVNKKKGDSVGYILILKD